MDISIIIPTLNRAALLRTTLQSILEQSADSVSFEVVVVDNGSGDETKEVCEKMKASFSRLKYVYDDMPGQLTGRHRGFIESKGAMLCYLDDDVVLNPNWISSISRLAKEFPGTSIFGGPSIPKFAVTPPLWLDRFWETTPYGGKMCLPLSLIDLQKENQVIDPLYVFGLNFSIRRLAFEDLKGFHPDCIAPELQRFQGDGETGLAIKASNASMQAMYSRSLTLEHQVSADRLTPAYFEKWSFYNGVCQSFTDLRYSNNLYIARKDRENSLSSRLVDVTSRIKRRLERIRSSKELTGMLDRITETYQNGYSFHQQAFRNDGKVRDWVLRKDFLDYKLP